MHPADNESPHHAGDHEPSTPPAKTDASDGRILVFTAEALRTIDRLALETYGIPTLLLMENAARALADAALELLDESPSESADPLHTPAVIILCGPGNNGGDGLAAARHLDSAGVRVAILRTHRDTRSQDAALHLQIAQRMGITIIDASTDAPRRAAETLAALGSADLIIDAMLGTGLTKPPEGSIRDLIHWANNSGIPILAADIPTGMDADTGIARDPTIRANATITFAGIKKGFLSLPAQTILGEVILADIGLPRQLLESLGSPVDPPNHHDHSSPDIPAAAEPARRHGKSD